MNELIKFCQQNNRAMMLCKKQREKHLYVKPQYVCNPDYFKRFSNIHSVSKTSPSFIGRSLVKHCLILTIFGRNIPEIYWLKNVFHFPSYLTCVPTLPREMFKKM